MKFFEEAPGDESIVPQTPPIPEGNQNSQESISESLEGKEIGKNVELLFGERAKQLYIGARLQLNNSEVSRAVLWIGLIALAVVLRPDSLVDAATNDIAHQNLTDLSDRLGQFYPTNATDDTTSFHQFGKIEVEPPVDQNNVNWNNITFEDKINAAPIDPEKIFTGSLQESHGHLPKPDDLPKTDDLIEGVTKKFSDITPEQSIEGVEKNFGGGSTPQETGDSILADKNVNPFGNDNAGEHAASAIKRAEILREEITKNFKSARP